MTRPVVPREPVVYRNGVYHDSVFRKPHRTLAMNVGGWVAVGLLMLGLGGSGVAMLAWAVHILWDLLVRH